MWRHLRCELLHWHDQRYCTHIYPQKFYLIDQDESTDDGSTTSETEESEEDESQDESKEKSRMREVELRVGPLSAETLRSDNQVMRALEILTGYEIFQHLKG